MNFRYIALTITFILIASCGGIHVPDSMSNQEVSMEIAAAKLDLRRLQNQKADPEGSKPVTADYRSFGSYEDGIQFLSRKINIFETALAQREGRAVVKTPEKEEEKNETASAEELKKKAEIAKAEAEKKEAEAKKRKAEEEEMKKKAELAKAEADKKRIEAEKKKAEAAEMKKKAELARIEAEKKKAEEEKIAAEMKRKVDERLKAEEEAKKAAEMKRKAEEEKKAEEMKKKEELAKANVPPVKKKKGPIRFPAKDFKSSKEISTGKVSHLVAAFKKEINRPGAVLVKATQSGSFIYLFFNEKAYQGFTLIKGWNKDTGLYTEGILVSTGK